METFITCELCISWLLYFSSCQERNSFVTCFSKVTNIAKENKNVLCLFSLKLMKVNTEQSFVLWHKLSMQLKDSSHPKFGRKIATENGDFPPQKKTCLSRHNARGEKGKKKKEEERFTIETKYTQLLKVKGKKNKHLRAITLASSQKYQALLISAL